MKNWNATKTYGFMGWHRRYTSRIAIANAVVPNIVDFLAILWTALNKSVSFRFGMRLRRYCAHRIAHSL